ncbi:MAG: hypothetical protein AABM43_09840 [Actinomycetota bacterium]
MHYQPLGVPGKGPGSADLLVDRLLYGSSTGAVIIAAIVIWDQHADWQSEFVVSFAANAARVT